MKTMEAKQKAAELIEKFKPGLESDYAAKACAIICVDELINHDMGNQDFTNMEYWQEVKTHLMK